MKRFSLYILATLSVMQFCIYSADNSAALNPVVEMPATVRSSTLRVPQFLKNYSTYALGGLLLGAVAVPAVLEYFLRRPMRVRQETCAQYTRADNAFENNIKNYVIDAYVRAKLQNSNDVNLALEDINGDFNYDIQVYIVDEQALQHLPLVGCMDTNTVCIFLSQKGYDKLVSFFKNFDGLSSLEKSECYQILGLIIQHIYMYKNILFMPNFSLIVGGIAGIAGAAAGSLLYGIPVGTWKLVSWAWHKIKTNKPSKVVDASAEGDTVSQAPAAN